MLTTSQRVRAVKLTVGRQVGESGDERLMHAIFCQALSDAFLPISDERAESKVRIRRGAKQYLRDEIPELCALNIDAEWIRRLLKNAGLDIKE